MDLNGLIVGEAVSLRMGYPMDTRKGRILHPLIRATRLLTSPARGLMVVGALVPLALYLGYATQGESNNSVHQRLQQMFSVAVAPRQPIDTTLVHSSAPHAPVHPALAEYSTPPIPAVTQNPGAAPSIAILPYPVPAGAVFEPSVNTDKPAGATVAVLAKPQAGAPVGQHPRTAELAAKPMTVLDVSKPPTTPVKDDAPQVVPVAGAVVSVAAEDPSMRLASPPDTKLPEMSGLAAERATKSLEIVHGSAPAETNAAQNKKTKTEKKQVPVKKAEPTKRVIDAKPQRQEVAQLPVPSRSRQELPDDDDAGFAKPIRQSGPQGRISQPAPAKPDPPVSVQSKRGGGRVEILDVAKNAVIVTNPKTNLPVMVPVGARLPTGQTLLGVDAASGAIKTSDGNFKIE